MPATFLDGATGGIIVVLQTIVFLVAFVVGAEARPACLPSPRAAGQPRGSSIRPLDGPGRRRGAGMNALFDALVLPFAFPFMRDALLISFLVAIPTALLSCYLVLKGWSLMGDAISHAVLPGVVVSYLVGLPLVVGAFAAGMICALATGYLKENSRIKQDTIMGIVFSGMFGLGIVLYTKIETDVHLDHILFGNMLGLLPVDIWQSGAIALVTAGAIAVKWRDLLLHAFDPQHAKAIGLPVRALHYGLLALLSLTIVGALKATGIILTVAMLIAPGADRISPDQAVWADASDLSPHRHQRVVFGRLSQLFPRQCTRAHDRPPDDDRLCRSLFLVRRGGQDRGRGQPEI
jgi:manganese/iron transport system permease protein